MKFTLCLLFINYQQQNREMERESESCEKKSGQICLRVELLDFINLNLFRFWTKKTFKNHFLESSRQSTII